MRGLVIASLLALAACVGAPRVERVLPAGHPADPHVAATPVAMGEDPFGAPPLGARTGEGRPEEAHGHAFACPMHPEVTSADPGSCPLCGMDLVRREELS